MYGAKRESIGESFHLRQLLGTDLRLRERKNVFLSVFGILETFPTSSTICSSHNSYKRKWCVLLIQLKRLQNRVQQEEQSGQTHQMEGWYVLYDFLVFHIAGKFIFLLYLEKVLHFSMSFLSKTPGFKSVMYLVESQMTIFTGHIYDVSSACPSICHRIQVSTSACRLRYLERSGFKNLWWWSYLRNLSTRGVAVAWLRLLDILSEKSGILSTIVSYGYWFKTLY